MITIRIRYLFPGILGISNHQLLIDLPCEGQELAVDEDAAESIEEFSLLHVRLFLEALYLSEELRWVRQLY